MQLGVWHPQYNIIAINAAGSGNLSARYQDRYQSAMYDMVLVFCDTEKKPYKVYTEVKNKINLFHGVDEAADHVVFFANPCTMQILVKHWSSDVLTTSAKKSNAPLIEQLTGIENYKGKQEQIRTMMSEHIDVQNYLEMKNRVQSLNTNYANCGSSNMRVLLEHLESEDTSWIGRINEILRYKNRARNRPILLFMRRGACRVFAAGAACAPRSEEETLKRSPPRLWPW